MEVRRLRRVILVLVALLAALTEARGQPVRLGNKSFLSVKRTTAKRYDADLRFTPPAALDKPFSVVFGQTAKGHYEATLDAGFAQLARTVEGKRTVLTRNGSFRLRRPLETLTLRRVDDFVAVIVNDTVACRAIDSTFAKGEILVQTGPGTPQVGKATVRRREAVFFSDDFMVTPDEAKGDRGWRPLAGTWECKSIRPETTAKVEAYSTRSANPFAYLGKPPSYDAFALAAIGERWWSDYSCRVAVKCLADGAAGLAFGCQDEKTFWLVRLECGKRFAAPERLQLVRVEDGKPRVVREKFVRVRYGHWYLLAAEVYPGRVRVSFLGSPVMDVADPRITGGRVALYAEGLKGAVFDDVEVAALARIRFDRKEELDAFGRQVSGTWRTEGRPNGSLVTLLPEGDDCLLLFGNPQWSGGAVTAEVRPDGEGTFGIVAGADGKRAYRLALEPNGRGSLMVKDTNGEQVLDTFAHRCRDGEWYKVGLNLSESGVVSAYVGGGLVARVKTADAPTGRVGLFARRADDVAFRSLVANRSPRLLALHQIGNAIFLTDLYMSSWATEQGQWIPDDGLDRARSMSGYTFTGKNVFWRKGDYYGDYVMILPLTLQSQPAARANGEQPPPVHTPMTGSLAVYFGLQSGDLYGGYSVRAAATSPGEYDVVLWRRKKVVAKVSGVRVAENAHEVRIYNSGRHLWAKIGERELFAYTKPDRGAGTRIAAVRSGDVDFARLAVYAENLDDSSFERCPTGWRVVGDWEITKRFRCDPRWSWMGVESLRGYSAMWRRREFPGDLTVTLYASMKMRAGSPYYVPSDLNLTIAADRESPRSGYTFIVGGWKNSKTVLLRNGKVVAQTTERYLPDTRDSYPASALLHRRWFYVKVRRKGPKLELYLDNKKYLEYTDPEPLSGGKMAVWTQEQSIMVARVQAFYSRTVLPTQTVPPPPTARAEAPPGPQPLQVRCDKRTNYYFDFETGPQGWAAGTAGAGNAMVTCDSGTAAGGDASLRLANAECPGRFVATIPVQKINVLACPVLSFDYKIPPNVKVNLYFDVGRTSTTPEQRRQAWRLRRRRQWRRKGGRRQHTRTVAARTYFIALTGPDESTEAVKLAGRFPHAKADNSWRTARINLAQVMRRFYPIEPAVYASNLRLAFDHRGTYALSGMGGNPRGAAYYLDNFVLATAAAGDAVLRWKPYTSSHSGYAVAVSKDADTDPGDQPIVSAPTISLASAEPGLRYVAVRPVLPGNAPRAPVTRLPLYEIGPKLDVIRISPPDRARWGGEPIRIHLRKSQVDSLDASSVAVTLGGVQARLDRKAVWMDWPNAVLTIDPSQLSAEFQEGAVVACSVTLRAYGQTQAEPVTWQYIASQAHDRTGPGPVVVESLYAVDTFEKHWNDWEATGYAACGIDTETAKSGKGSLRLFNSQDGGNFLVYRNFTGRRVGECPIIEFDYKAGLNVRSDLAMYSSSGYFTFKFFDRSPLYRIGSIPKVVADGKWHSVSLDTFNTFWKSDRIALSSQLRWIGFGDYGWASAREGDCFHIDNFRVIPVASCRNGLELKWDANDPLGVAGCAYLWSAKPTEEPPKRIMSAGDTVRVAALPEGRRYLHIRAVDRAGNWGPTVHHAFLIDNTPPVISAKKISPRPGSKTVPYRFGVTIQDAYGPDPAKLRFTVDRKAYTFGSPSLHTARRPAIAWNLMLTPEDITPIPDGKVLEFSLTGVEDFAGNAVEPIRGAWTMDYRRDRTAPQRVEMDPPPGNVAMALRFDRGLDGAQAHGRGRAVHTLSSDVASRGLLYTPSSATTQGILFRRRGAINLAKTGIIKMDVKLSTAPTYIDLLLVGQGFNAKLRVGDPVPKAYAPKVGSADKDGYVYLGAMNGIRANDGWHTQWADLYALVKKAFPGLASYTVRSIRMGRYCTPYCRARRTYFDNILVYGYGSKEMKLTLRSRDITGLSGYAVDVSADPKRLPAKKVNHKGDVLTRTLGPGVWYVKAFACDNNGNWSRVPGVLPYVVK